MAQTDLLGLTAELVAVPSVSHHEAALADLIESRLAGCGHLEVVRLGDNVVARTDFGRPKRLMVAGHLDTVPAGGNATPRVDGDVVWGLGAADMKGTLAVMVTLAAALEAPRHDVTWCFYAREEVGRHHSGLLELHAARPELLAADAAVLGEPTEALVEAGCQGTMRVEVTLAGVRAHSARPFVGRNAVHRLGPVLEVVRTGGGREVDLQGCRYAEQLQAVQVEGGVARNVVPDLATVALNYRFAPDRQPEEAEAFVRRLLEGVVEPEAGDQVVVTEVAAGAPPSLDTPLLAELVERSGAPPRAKVGWTDVATFFSLGVPAVNFGAGDPLLAHHRDERVARGSLESVHRVLAALLGGSG
jgi:succinyl-diaminopimelate desuccinylase